MARKSLLLFITNIINSLLGLASTFVVARLMGPGPLGTVGYLLGLTGLLASFSDLGLSITHRKRVSERNDYGECVGAFTVAKSALTGALTVCVLLIPPFSQVVLGRPVLNDSAQRWSYYLLAGTYIFNNLAAIFLLTFEARLESSRVSVALMTSSFVTAVAKIVVALMGFGVIALSAAFLAESLTLFVVAWLLFLGHPFRRPSRALLASYAVYAAPLVVTMILSGIIVNLDRVMLRQFWNEEEVGYYVGILGIVAVLDKVSSAAMKSFFPRVSYDAAHGDLGAIRKRLAAAERYLFMVMVPVVVGVIAFRYLLIRILLGPEFMPAASALAILALDSLFLTYFRPYGNLIYALEQQSKLIIGGILQLVVLVIANALLVPRQLFGVPLAGLGNTGTALAYVAMLVTAGIFDMTICARYAGIGPYWRAVRYVPAGLAMYLVLWLAERLTGSLGIWQALVFGPLGVAVFVGVLTLVGEFTRADAALFFDLVDPRKMIGYVVTELRSTSETA